MTKEVLHCREKRSSGDNHEKSVFQFCPFVYGSINTIEWKCRIKMLANEIHLSIYEGDRKASLERDRIV